MISWSTDTVHERERFAFWHEVVCQSLFNLSMEASPEHFSGRVIARSSGAFRFVKCESTGYQVARTRRDISRAPADHYQVYVHLRGQTVLSQPDESVDIRRNDIIITDGRQPYRAVLSDDGYRRSQVIAVIPRVVMDRRAPWLRRRCVHTLASNSRFVDLARRYLLQLTSNELSESETSLLADNLCNLLALASATDLAPSQLQPELQITALTAFCRQNLHCPELSPHFVAERFGISVRSLHLRFEKLGQTFGRWLLETRLDACGRVLRDPRQQRRSISDIAYSSGFNDLSHFNKTFRARFGMPPSQWRHESSMKAQ